MEDLPSWFKEHQISIRNTVIAIVLICGVLYVALREWQFSIIHQAFLPISCVWLATLIVWTNNSKNHPNVIDF